MVTLVNEIGLVLPTTGQHHRVAGLMTIDHIAIRAGAHKALRVDATGLSDHDFYTVETGDYDATHA